MSWRKITTDTRWFITRPQEMPGDDLVDNVVLWAGTLPPFWDDGNGEFVGVHLGNDWCCRDRTYRDSLFMAAVKNEAIHNMGEYDVLEIVGPINIPTRKVEVEMP